MSSLTGKCAAQKLKNLCSSSLWTCLHHMVILRRQNKITDFFMILAWAKYFTYLRDWPNNNSILVQPPCVYRAVGLCSQK